jgi:hypothetical protein
MAAQGACTEQGILGDGGSRRQGVKDPMEDLGWMAVSWDPSLPKNNVENKEEIRKSWSMGKKKKFKEGTSWSWRPGKLVTSVARQAGSSAWGTSNCS